MQIPFHNLVTRLVPNMESTMRHINWNKWVHSVYQLISQLSMYLMNPHARASRLPRQYLRKVPSEGERLSGLGYTFWPNQSCNINPDSTNSRFLMHYRKMGWPSSSVNKSTRVKLIVGPKFQSCKYFLGFLIYLIF